MADEKQADKKPEDKKAEEKPEKKLPEHPAAPKETHLVKEFKHGQPFIGCRIDPTGQYVFASSQDFSIQRYEIESGTATAFQGHDSWVRGLTFTPDGAQLISGGFDGRIIWWEAGAAEPKPVHQIDDAHAGWVRAVAVSPDGQQLASCGNDNLVKLWTIDGKPIKSFAGHERHVYNVVFHPDGQSLASMDLMGKIKHWEIASGNQLRELDGSKLHKYDTTFRADIGGARSMAFRPDGGQLACGGITGVTNAFAGVGNVAVLLLDWETGKEVQLHVGQKNVRGTIWGVEFHPGGYLMGACGGNGGMLFFWKPDEAKSFHEMKLPNDARDLSLHPDELQFATCHHDGRVRIFKMAAKPKGDEKKADAKEKK